MEVFVCKTTNSLSKVTLSQWISSNEGFLVVIHDAPIQWKTKAESMTKKVDPEKFSVAINCCYFINLDLTKCKVSWWL
jgi:hypothetical protein